MKITFVFLGSSLPRYVLDSMSLASRHNRLEVELVGNESARKSTETRGIQFTDVNNFYDNRVFETAKSKVSFDHSFRDGFWLRTLERIFVLEQFMAFKSRESIFHAEADQLLFGTEMLVNKLEESGLKGVFFPFHNPFKAVASVLYCNDHNSMIDLVQEAISGPPINNEMELLVRWSGKSSARFWALPTLGDRMLEPKVPRRILPESSIGGIVDAAELGLWLGGRDPRNLNWRVIPSTHYSYPATKARLNLNTLRGLRFEFNQESSELRVTTPGGEATRLYNLHLHSKTHSWVAKKGQNLQKLFNVSNDGRTFKIPGTSATQLRGWFRLALADPKRAPSMLTKLVRNKLIRRK